MIKLNNLRKSYNAGKPNAIKAVNDVSLELPDKGLVMLYGKSGCGKTTLLNCIGGLDKADGGTVTVGDVTLKGYKVDDWDAMRNEHIGYIFQNYNLIAEASVYRNLEVALEIAGMKDRKEMKKRITYALTLVGMEKYKSRMPGALSGGQQQRVGIARALAKAPSIIIADEPTGNLDDKNTLQIMDLLKQISEYCLVLLVTHEERIARFYADRVIQIVDGKIVADVSATAGAQQKLSHRTEDKIYLGDLNETASFADGNVAMKLYSDKPVDGNVNLSLAYYDGQLYVRADAPVRVQYLDDSSEVKLLPGKYEDKVSGERLSDKLSVDKDILSPIAYGKHSIFSTKNIIKGALRRRRETTKKRRAPYSLMFVMAVIMTFVLALVAKTFVYNDAVNKTHDDAIIRVELKEGENYTQFKTLEGTHGISRVLHAAQEITIVNLSYLNADAMLYGYSESQYTEIGLQSMPLPVGVLTAKDLAYGRLPANDSEAVIDNLLIKRLDEAGNLLSNGILGAENLLNEHLSVGGVVYRIVGISAKASPHVYIPDVKYAALNENMYMTIDNEYVNYMELYCENKGEAQLYCESQNMKTYDYEKNERKDFYRDSFRNSITAFVFLVIMVVVSVLSSKKLAHGGYILRIKELGTMRAIGATRGNIFKLFFVEGGAITMAYSIAGALLASAYMWFKLSTNLNWRMLLYYPVWLAIVFFAFLFVTNIAAYTSSILGIIRKTPAEILTKYDI